MQASEPGMTYIDIEHLQRLKAARDRYKTFAEVIDPHISGIQELIAAIDRMLEVFPVNESAEESIRPIRPN